MEKSSSLSVDILNVFSFPALLAFICVCIFYIRVSQGKKAVPPSYPIVGSLFCFLKNRRRLPQWFTELLKMVPSHTIKLDRLGGRSTVITANPANVKHILKTRFEIYPKGDLFSLVLHDLLGGGIFNADGENWKLQRRVASFEFSTKSLRDFIHETVHGEVTDRLLPLLRKAAASGNQLDMQDVLQRFAFDNICKVAFGTDPGCLDISLPVSEFAENFEVATALIVRRFGDVLPFGWRVKRMLNLGSEKTLRHAIQQVHGFAEEVIRKRKEDDKCHGHQDLLSRFLGVAEKDSHANFLRDIVISFILAGRDTTSAALTWFFWLLSSHPQVEERINGEIAKIVAARAVNENTGFCYEELKEMNYLHAAISESMRLYPPVPSDTKEALEQNVLPDGTVVNKGTRVTYHPYAMGRMESIWGKDCLEFKPERWVKEEENGSVVFVSENSFKYPVFQAGPRICLGKEMAFIQMKCIAASVIEEFSIKVDPNLNPKFIVSLSAKMENGLPIVVEKRSK